MDQQSEIFEVYFAIMERVERLDEGGGTFKAAGEFSKRMAAYAVLSRSCLVMKPSLSMSISLKMLAMASLEYASVIVS